MEVAVVAGLFAKRDMDVDSGHFSERMYELAD